MRLADQHCSPQRGAPLSAPEAAELGRELQGWTVHEGGLQKDFASADYAQTMAFVNAVAALAEREDHHPEMHVHYGRCRVRWSTHSVGGLSRNDFICAARVDAMQP